jgi:uncharacterized membrane protein
MSIEYFVLKTGRYASLIFLVIFLFLKYYQLPDPVAVYFQADSKPAGFLPKSQFFYSICAIILIFFIVFQVLLSLLAKHSKTTTGQYILGKSIGSPAFKNLTENWINLISTALHTLVMVAVLILAKLNSTEYPVTVANYTWFIPFILVCLAIIIAYPLLKIVTIK